MARKPRPKARAGRSRAKRTDPSPPPATQSADTGAAAAAEIPIIDVAPPPSPVASPETPQEAAELERVAGEIQGDELGDELRAVITPETAGMLLSAAFGVAAVATGEPEIWQASDDEIRPLEKPLAHQLARIPIVRAVGPDNTELGILVLGIGVMVTRRLNEHAEKRQATRTGAAAAAMRAARAPTSAPARDGEDGPSAADLLSPR